MAMAARMPMIATTIISSMRVKPRWPPILSRLLFHCSNICVLLFDHVNFQHARFCKLSNGRSIWHARGAALQEFQCYQSVVLSFVRGGHPLITHWGSRG